MLYGVLVVRLTRFEQGEFQLLIDLQRWVFFGFMQLMYLATFWTVFFLSRGMTDHYEKRFIRNLGLLYLLYMGVTTTALSLSGLHVVVEHIFFFLFLSWHLVPILFLSLYLEKYGKMGTFTLFCNRNYFNLYVKL